MLRCAVITGSGTKAFCSGQDLVEATRSHGENRIDETWLNLRPPSGFAGLSQRTGKKPVIAAVNGYAFGGGFEIVLNWYVPNAVFSSLGTCSVSAPLVASPHHKSSSEASAH